MDSNSDCDSAPSWPLKGPLPAESLPTFQGSIEAQQLDTTARPCSYIFCPFSEKALDQFSPIVLSVTTQTVWEAQLVKHLTHDFCSGRDLMGRESREIKPRVRFCTQWGVFSVSSLLLSLSPFLCPSPHSYTFSLK